VKAISNGTWTERKTAFSGKNYIPKDFDVSVTVHHIYK